MSQHWPQNYRSKRSANISLAARTMKRRALGLTVR